MKKLIAIVIFCLSVFIIFFMSVLLFADYSNAYKNFLANLNIQIPQESVGHIQIHKFPVPYLTIDNLKEDGQAQIENLQIKFSLLSLIKFKPEISQLQAGKVTIKLTETEDIEFNLVSHHRVISDIIKKGFGNINIDIANLNFIDKNARNILSIRNFNFNGSKEFNGKYNNAPFVGKLNVLSDNGNFDISINSQTLKLNEHYENFTLKSGKAQLQVNDFQYFLNYFIPDINNIFTTVTSKEVINIDLDILNQLEVLTFNNISISSPSGEIKGNGVVKLASDSNLLNEVNFNFTKISLETTNARDNPDVQPSTAIGSSISSNNQFIMNNKLANINIVIEELLFNNQKIDGFNFSAGLNKNILDIKNCSGNIGVKGGFLIEGNITNNNYRSIFDGHLSLQHENFNDILALLGYGAEVQTTTALPFILNSNLKFSSIDLYLQDILLKTPESQMSGKVAIKFIGTTPRITAGLEFVAINLDKIQYPVLTPAINFISGLATGMKENDYLGKFIPIRTINYSGNLDLTFNNLTLRETNLNKVNLLVNISPAKLEVENVYLSNMNNDFFSAKMTLNAYALKPLLNVRINDGSIPVSFLRPSFIIDLQQKLINEYNISKVILKLSGNLSKIYQDDFEIRNIIFELQNDDILFKLSNFQANLFGGILSGNGSILLNPYSLNFAYAFNSIDLNQLSKIIPKSILLNDRGSLSINGTLGTNGDTLEKLLYNLNLNSKLIAKGVNVSNISIDDFITQINSKNYNIVHLNSDVKKALLTGNTVIETLEGDMNTIKGVILLKNMTFKTASSAGAFAAALNIYDFNLNLSSIFSFYLNGKHGQKAATVRLPIKAEGSFFQPSKTVDDTELKDALTFANSNNKEKK